MKKQIPINLIFLAGAMLSGPVSCASYQEAGLTPARSAKDFASRTLSDEGLVKFLGEHGAAKGRWTVNRLALAAVYYHGDIAVARAAADEAAAKITTAGQIPNPVLSFSPNYQMSGGGISPWVITPQIKMTIETAGKRQLRVDQSRTEVEAAHLRISAAAWVVWKEIRAAMLEWHASRQIGKLLETTVALNQDAINLLQIQVDAGDASAFELTLARQSFNSAKLDLQNAEKRRNIAIARLASAVGIPSASLKAVSLDFSTFKKSPSDPGPKARHQALLNRADLLALLADYAAADVALRLEIAKQYPDVQIAPGYGRNQNDETWLLGIGVVLPVFHQNQGGIAEAVARRKSAGKIFNAKQAAVFGEIETALADFRSSYTKVNIASRLAEEARQASATTRSMVDAGELTRLELIRRQIQSNTSTLALEQAKIEAQTAIGALEMAVQITYQNAK